MADEDTDQLAPTEDVPVVVRSAEKREIDVRLAPFNKTINTRQGLEEFAPGSFDHIAPDGLLLQGLEHDAGIGLGQDGQPKMTRRPQGRSTRLWSDPNGQYATFKVARTQAGDEMIALADDRVIRGVSVEMTEDTSGIQSLTRNGRKVRRYVRAPATGAALTYRPAYEDAAIMAVRSEEDTVPDNDAPAAAGMTAEDKAQLIAAFSDMFNKSQDVVIARVAELEDERRKDVDMPVARAADDGPKAHIGDWASTTLRLLAGDAIPKEQMRTWEDVTTGDNLGVVPPAYLTEIIGIIDASRPFLSSTRRLALPAAGLDIKVPRITQRPEVDVQDAEKTEIASRPTKIDLATFSAITIAGGADISLQLIKRSSPEFLSLFIELLAEQYAIISEEEAVTALANAMGGWATSDTLDPEDLSLGAAYVTSFDAIRRPPDTIWLSTRAVGDFIDAKATTTNQPLYSSIQASATAAGGITGFVQGLRAVHVPALDIRGAYAVVGPAAGFAWTEDGTYTLQVDVPSKAGRDVAIVGLLFPAPWYPDAFTHYHVLSTS